MLNIKYIRKIRNCNSVIKANSALGLVEKQLSNMLQDKSVEYIKNCNTELYVTLIVNPSEEELNGSFKHSDSIYSILSDKLNGDSHLYSVRNRLGQIQFPSVITQLLIAIGLTEYSIERKEENDSDDDKDKPVFFLKEPKWTFEDIILSNQIKERIYRALSIIENKDLIFSDWGFASVDKATKSILCLYGPAGTGKTMTAEAIGSYLHKPIVHSSYAEIESKWVGEGAKNLHAIFKFAEENDAVLFFDEADSFLSSRIESTESSSDKHYNRMSNELFQLLEDFNGCIIFSTNLLKDVDEAFKSRIIDSIKFSLPNTEERVLLIKRMIPDKFPLTKQITEKEYLNLSEKIEGFSGRDIRKAILLSLAGAATKVKGNGVKSFSYEDILAGFEEVIAYKASMLAENGILSNDEVSSLVRKQRFHENIVDIAIHAMLYKGVIHDEEKELLNQLSMALLGTPISEPIELPVNSIQDICEKTTDADEKKTLIETAIRVICIDGIVEPSEQDFIKQLIMLLDVRDGIDSELLNYCDKLAELNKIWSNISLFNS